MCVCVYETYGAQYDLTRLHWRYVVGFLTYFDLPLVDGLKLNFSEMGDHSF